MMNENLTNYALILDNVTQIQRNSTATTLTCTFNKLRCYRMNMKKKQNIFDINLRFRTVVQFGQQPWKQYSLTVIASGSLASTLKNNWAAKFCL